VLQRLLIAIPIVGLFFAPAVHSQEPRPVNSTTTGLQDPPIWRSTPTRSRGTGGGCSFAGILVRIPSKSAGTEGLVVRLSPPAQGRFPKGAPVAVHMLSAIPSVGGSIACLSEQGFIDIAFLAPGAQYKAADGTIVRSGGSPSPPDPMRLVEPLADVLSFATGNTRSLENKSMQDYMGAMPVLTENVGVIGWSVGGNIAVLAMAQYGERFPNLRWYASWESPFLGETEDLGSVAEANPFYDAATGKIAFDSLRYSAEMPIWVFPPQATPPAANWPRGGLYLDGDGDHQFSKGADFAFFANMGGPGKFYYSLRVTTEAAERKVFGAEWPKHIATLAEVQEKIAGEDPLAHVPAVVRRFPELSVLVFESRQNHVIDALDHPHTVAQVAAWIDGGAHWVRFNPDSHYVEATMGKKPLVVIQQPAGRKIDRKTIQGLLEPETDEGGPTDKEGMTASVCELADRTYWNVWSPVLAAVLHK
jgi:hypothetical protein